MKTSYNSDIVKKNIYIWGAGQCMRDGIGRLDRNLKIKGILDNNEELFGKEVLPNIKCIGNKCNEDNAFILVALYDSKRRKEVYSQIEDWGIGYCDIQEAIDFNWEKTEIKKSLVKYGDNSKYEEKIVKFINCHVPYKFCNLSCHYCYVRQVREFENGSLKLHSPEFVARALAPERLGGKAFINFCASGETLLVSELVGIIDALLQEGHYVQIVTNGTVNIAFDRLLQMKGPLEHLFVKFSFHYMELLRTKKLDDYFNNINKMRSAGSSITVELVAADELIPYIDEIKRISMIKMGALPHLTIPRDDNSDELVILSNLCKEDYYRVWSDFESEMFEFKWRNLSVKRFEKCMAGEWSFQMNLETGDIEKCLSNPWIDNIYQHIDESIHLEPVLNKCRLPYCYNCHAYLTLGLIKEIEAPTYFEVRNRVDTNGKSWIGKELQEIFSQKLFDNN